MTRTTVIWTSTIVTTCVALGAASSLAVRLVVAGQVGVGLLAAGAACIALTSMMATAASAPPHQHAPVAICLLIAVFSFLVAWSFPFGGVPAPGHHMGGHAHAATTT